MAETTDGARALGETTIAALVEAVEAAKARGWLSPDLRRWFGGQGVELSQYLAAKRGEAVADDAAATLAAISVTGLPERPHAPNPIDIRRHLNWLIAPARGAYDDALIEIAWSDEVGGVNRAQLFGFDELEAAIDRAVQLNTGGRNVYVGAGLRLPDAPRHKRSSAEDFYVATAVPIDIDADYDRVRAAMAAVCDDGLVVTTGLTPSRRSQHWTRLIEPCDDDMAFGAAFAALVDHTGADGAVKDAARVMRLGGTVSYPNARKAALGYCTELTAVSINDAARPSYLQGLLDLSPGEGGSGQMPSREAGDNAIHRAGILGAGLVIDGREKFFATKILPRAIHVFQVEHGADPSPDDLWALAYERFCAEADNNDERWTSPAGQKALRARVHNTLRRLRLGRLARIGLYSIETGAGEAEAKAADAAWRAAHPFETGEREQAEQGAAFQPPPDPDDGDDEPFCANELTGDPPARRWIVDQWIPEGVVCSLYGDGGLGKTLLMQQLACAAATGGRWLGMSVAPCRVLAVLCEDERDELHRRQNSIKAAMGYLVGSPFERLFLWPRLGRDNTLVRWSKDGAPVLTPFATKLVNQVERLAPDLLILDTLADFYGGNEIDRVQVNYFVKTVLGGMIERRRKAGAALTVVLLGHPSVAGKSTGSGYSGSTAWNAAVRARMYLSRPEDDAPGDERILTRGKANYAKSGDETAIRLFYADGVLHAEEDAEDGDSILWAAKRDIRSLVDRAWNTGEPFSAQKTHRRYIYNAILNDMQKGGFGPQITRQALREMIVDDGEIAVSNSNGKRGYRTPGGAK